MSDASAKYIHALRSIPDIGNGTLAMLLEHFGSGEAIWRAHATAIEALPKLSARRKSALVGERQRIDPDTLWEKLLALDIALHIPSDPTYPALLREMPDRPQTLYTRGTYRFDQPKPGIAIVGSRKHSSYGEQVATKLAEDLCRAGFVIVSGMAFGIDAQAHKGALETGGETLAVLGGSVDDSAISPVSHFQLAQKIMGHGALVSEYPPGILATQGAFPMRDRIIAGLCLGTIVIEAPERSGSLITASCALDYNRQVFAVPGSIFSPYSIGTNLLIKRGAKIVMGVSDILEEFPESVLTMAKQNGDTPTPIVGLSLDEQKLLTLLTHEPLHIDRIIKMSGLETASVGSLLTLLEMKGLAKNVGAMHYVKVQ